jgi:hypothetical protein
MEANDPEFLKQLFREANDIRVQYAVTQKEAS